MLKMYETIYFWLVVDFTIIGLLAIFNRKTLIEIYKTLTKYDI